MSNGFGRLCNRGFSGTPIFFDKPRQLSYYILWTILSEEEDDMLHTLLENTETGKEYPFTFEAVGACNPETLALSISEIQTHNLPVTRIVSIVGLDELCEKGWIRPMLQMAQDAGIRLIVPPVSPLMEMYDGKLEMRWNYSTLEGPWLGTAWNDATLEKCFEVLDAFVAEYDDEFDLDNHFGILATDPAVLVVAVDFFTKVSVLCGTSNSFRAEMAANSINLLPMGVEQVREISQFVGDSSLIDVYIDPPASIRPPWYDLETVIALAPQYIEAGAFVLKAEGTENIGQLLDSEYLTKIAIPRQTHVFLEVMDALNASPYVFRTQNCLL